MIEETTNMKQPQRPWNRAGRYLGRRGGILVLFGLAWMLMGFGFANIHVDRFSRPGPGGPIEFMDSTPYPGILWLVCGVIAVISGLIRRRRKNEDAVGYAALILPPFVWFFAYIISWVIWIVSAGLYGVRYNWIGAIVYLIIIISILVISHWRDDLDEKYLILMRVKDPIEASRLLNSTRAERKRSDGE
jgi:hypothetical protein